MMPAGGDSSVDRDEKRADEADDNNPKSNPTVIHKIINITDESISQTEVDGVSIVDPWVPRIANNDEYLQLGLDFSINVEEETNENDVVEEEEESEVITSMSPFVGDCGAKRLASALSCNNLLLYLNLSNNRIGVEGGKAIARSLFDADGNPSRSALRRLNLSCNSIGNDGARAFGETLLYNNTLETLDLSDNKIGIDGIVALLEGLKSNDAIKILKLCDNVQKISDIDMERLVMCVAKVLEAKSYDLDGGRLEEIDMGSNCTTTTKNNDNIVDDGILDVHSMKLMRVMVTEEHYNNTKQVNHRFRTLTLPTSKIHRYEIKMSELQRLLGFNSFYRPVLELHDQIRANKTKDDATTSHVTHPIHYFQRDVETGALIGLLPSSSSLARSTGIGYKLMPRVIAFVGRKCILETVYNLVRYRPDIFSCCSQYDTSRTVECGSNNCHIL